MPWRYGRVSRLKDVLCPHIIFEIVHVHINTHNVHLIFIICHFHMYNSFGTLLKCHGTSNSPTTNVMHQPHIVRNEWGQRWNFFNMFLYASKFDMVGIDTCLDSMGGFQDSRMYDFPTKSLRSSTFSSTFFMLHLSFSSFIIPFYRIIVRNILKFDMELQIHPSQISSTNPSHWAVNGANVEIFQSVPICIEIWHG